MSGQWQPGDVDPQRRDWAIVNACLLMKHRHVHPLIREKIRWWIEYGKGLHG